MQSTARGQGKARTVASLMVNLPHHLPDLIGLALCQFCRFDASDQEASGSTEVFDHCLDRRGRILEHQAIHTRFNKPREKRGHISVCDIYHLLAQALGFTPDLGIMRKNELIVPPGRENRALRGGQVIVYIHHGRARTVCHPCYDPFRFFNAGK